MNDVVVEMHTKSGLLDAIAASTITLAEAGARDAGVPPGAHPEPSAPCRCAATRSAPTAGSSRRYLPEIEEFLHYRSRRRVDHQGAGQALEPDDPDGGRPARREGHRALDDIRESVAELRYYRETLFILPRALTGAPTGT